MTKPGDNDARRDQRVGRHVQEGAAQVEVALRPAANSQAVTPLTTMPIAATTITVLPATGSGWPRRRIASQEIAPTVSSRKTALNSAARIDEPRRP